ncbi:A24 family peptidase [Primorskyibacter aestuariivivens]|uniref:prepilin peptidase n=1 Tax=Primorskyibacter aestuariivivens TaxID=1888912 RepID=UPI002300CD75|nr:A24 family peptidase [Primorskyibacter aestuariivivens]MDA7426918.1 A24 family peptidase [Primorskyibacter aestuariivivens]
MLSVPVVTFVAARLSLGWAESILATLCGLCLMSLITCDLLRFRLPDPLTGGLLISALALSVAAPPPDWRAALATGLVCAALLWALRAGYRALRGQHGLGLGDVKLAAGIGALTGPFGAAPTLLLASLIALGWAIVQKRPLSRQARLPFGAALAAAAWLVWIWQRIPPAG